MRGMFQALVTSVQRTATCCGRVAEQPSPTQLDCCNPGCFGFPKGEGCVLELGSETSPSPPLLLFARSLVSTPSFPLPSAAAAHTSPLYLNLYLSTTHTMLHNSNFSPPPLPLALLDLATTLFLNHMSREKHVITLTLVQRAFFMLSKFFICPRSISFSLGSKTAA